MCAAPSASNDAENLAGIGCDRCLPPDAADAWVARRDLTTLATPIDEPHFIVSILGCTRCEQRYVSVFTETVDWVAGDDPQHWQVMPVSTDEAAALTRSGASLQTAQLSALPPRRCLVVDHPSGANLMARWGHGLSVPHHD